MAITATTVAGIDLYPSNVRAVPMRLGGGIRRSLSGKGYRKRTATKWRVVLRFDFVTPEEMANIRAVWHLADQGTVPIVDAAEGINGTYLSADDELPFQRVDGNSLGWTGTLTFEEQ